MDVPDGPEFSSQRLGDAVRLSLGGHWTVDASAAIEARADGFLRKVPERAGLFSILAGSRGSIRRGLGSSTGRARRLMPKASMQRSNRSGRNMRSCSRSPLPGSCRARAAKRLLYHPPFRRYWRERGFCGIRSLQGVGFLGEVVAAISKSLANPSHFRGTSLIVQMESIALRGTPIIALINFLAGAIIAQQGIFQLRRFGATFFVVDLIGILVLRELGVFVDRDHDRRALRLGDHR